MTTLDDVVKAFLWGKFDKMPLRSTQGKLQAEHNILVRMAIDDGKTLLVKP